MEESQDMEHDRDARLASDGMELESASLDASQPDAEMQVEDDGLMEEEKEGDEITRESAASVREELHDTAMGEEVEEQEEMEQEQDVEDQPNHHENTSQTETIQNATAAGEEQSATDDTARPSTESQAAEAVDFVEASNEDVKQAAEQPHHSAASDEDAQPAISSSYDHVPAQSRPTDLVSEVPGGADISLATNNGQEHADESIAGNFHPAFDEYGGPSSEEQHSPQRAILQKDYLAHIEAYPGSSNEDEHSNRSAPHVSLVYGDAEYSLFRASSSPSGDEEEALFTAGGEFLDNAEPSGPQQINEHDIYYGPVEDLMQRLHAIFPSFKGDGDNEMILDFGILDIQISEDNVYASQVSLHDFDRVRIGMCQPELDRLQITLLAGKRFAYKFNELAEHCYRMYAGNEDDDLGTITYDEDPLQPEHSGEHGEYADVPEYGEEEEVVAAEEEATDYTTGQNLEDLSPDQQLNELQTAEVEVERNSCADPPTQAAQEKQQHTNAEEAQLSVEEAEPRQTPALAKLREASADDNGPEEGPHLGTDEDETREEGHASQAQHNDHCEVDDEGEPDNAGKLDVEGENPDGSEEAAETQEAGGNCNDGSEEAAETQEAGGNCNDGESQGDEQYADIDEGNEVIEADAPIDEAVEQAEAYEETEVTEDLLTAAESAGISNSSSASVGRSGVKIGTTARISDEDESPLERPGHFPDEETVLIEENDTVDALANASDQDHQSSMIKVTKGDIIGEDGELLEEAESEVHSSATNKRPRDEDTRQEEEVFSDGSDTKRTKIEG